MRKVKLIGHLSDDELKLRYDEAFNNEVRKRWQLLWLIQSQGYTIEKASNAVGHSRSWGKGWIKVYKKEGSIGIVRVKSRNMGNRKVTEEMKLDLLERLDFKPPVEIGGGLWSGPKVKLFLKVFYNIEIKRFKGWNR